MKVDSEHSATGKTNKGFEEYGEMVEAAKKAGHKVIENAHAGDIVNAMKDEQCTELIFYTHGHLVAGKYMKGEHKHDDYEATLEYYLEGGEAPKEAPIGDIVNKNNLGDRKESLKIRIVCCHWGKVCPPAETEKAKKLNVDLKPIKVPRLDHPQKGEILPKVALKVLTERFEEDAKTNK